MRMLAAVVLATTIVAAPARELPDAAALERAAAVSARHGETALLVWCRGRTLLERGDGAAPRVFSVTKSLVAIGVMRSGAAISQPVANAAARGVALADLLNQTSGLPSAQSAFYTRGLKDKESVLRGLRREGSSLRFVYGPSHWEVLEAEVMQRTGNPAAEWLRRFVPGVAGALESRWRRDDAGRPFFSTGARLQVRELLPAAREVLRGIGRGRWSAEARRLLASGTAANRMYALGFWLNRGAGQSGAREIPVEDVIGQERDPSFWRDGCLSRVAPDDLVAMVGTRGQRVYVVPSLDLIVIRQGLGAGFSDASFLSALFGR
jgi:CubicO group peptidase (beta-lactamase class C family)